MCVCFFLVEIIQSHPQHFNDSNQIGQQRRLSDVSLQSTVSGLVESVPLSTVNACE